MKRNVKHGESMVRKMFGKRVRELTPEERSVYKGVWKKQTRDQRREYYRLHKKEINAKRRERLITDPAYAEQKRAYLREWYKSNPDKAAKNRRRTLLQRHGLTVKQYEQMLAEQGGRCAICRSDESHNSYDVLAVDHDHKTSRVRALLCHRCNLFIGLACEDVELLLRAIVYIKKHRNECAA